MARLTFSRAQLSGGTVVAAPHVGRALARIQPKLPVPDADSAIEESDSGRAQAYRGINLFREALDGYAKYRRDDALAELRRQIQDQLQPNQRVDVYLGRFSQWEGSFESVEISDGAVPSIRAGSTTVLRVLRNGGATGAGTGRTEVFVVIENGKPVLKPLGGKSGNGRPGMGVLRDFFERWNKDPGTFDHDWQKKDKTDKVA